MTEDQMKDIFASQRVDVAALAASVKNPGLADGFYERLVKMINEFDAKLDQDHEVGVRLVSFGQEVTFHIQDIGYWNPALIVFYGFSDNKEPVQLIQHISQISILLTKLPKLDPLKPKVKIGFKTDK